SSVVECGLCSSRSISSGRGGRYSLFASCVRSVGHGRRGWGGRGVVAGGTVGAGVAEGLVVVAWEGVRSCSVSAAKCACCRVSCSLGGGPRAEVSLRTSYRSR